MTETIGDRVRRVREAQKISRKDLATYAGIGVSTLSDLELGLSESTTKLHRIAEKLGVSAQWLESGRGAKAVSAGSEKSQPAGLDAGTLQQSIKFLDDVFLAAGKAFVPSSHTHLIAAVYSELQAESSPNLVALSIKYGKLVGGESERKVEAGSTGKNDQGRARRRAGKA